MKCNYVKDHLVLTKTINAETKEQFIEQFKELLIESKPYTGLVYVWNTQRPIPRSKGMSTVVYIGKAEGSMFTRYSNTKIRHEAIEFWDRYRYFIREFGELQIDIHLTTNPSQTENNFLYHYHSKHMELPPLNLRSFRRYIVMECNLIAAEED